MCAPQFRVKQTPAGATPIPTHQSLEADALQDAAIIRAAAAAAAAEEGAAGGGANAGGVDGSGSGGAIGANGSGAADEQPQRFRSATLLRQPGAGLAKAAELMRASQAISQDGATRKGVWRWPAAKGMPLALTASPAAHSYLPQAAGCRATRSGQALRCLSTSRAPLSACTGGQAVLQASLVKLKRNELNCNLRQQRGGARPRLLEHSWHARKQARALGSFLLYLPPHTQSYGIERVIPHPMQAVLAAQGGCVPPAAGHGHCVGRQVGSSPVSLPVGHRGCVFSLLRFACLAVANAMPGAAAASSSC